MNTATIAALYPYFLDSLRYANAAQTMEALLVRRLQADQVPTSRSYSHSLALTDVDHPGQPADWLAEAAGVTLQEFAPERVFNWVCQQVPALTADYQPKPATGWHVYLQATARDQATGPNLHLYATTTSAELAPALRGLRAYQVKRYKRARRLLAQLRAYHGQRVAAEAEQAAVLMLAEASATAAALATLAAGCQVSCLHLPAEEYLRRVDLAEEAEERMQAHYDRPTAAYGREIMWHPVFATELIGSVSRMPLPEVAINLGNLADDMNQGNDLDLADYCYLADCLREGLADNPTPLAALRLTRALTWVEQAGAALLTTEPTALPSEVATPILRAAA